MDEDRTTLVEQCVPRVAALLALLLVGCASQYGEVKTFDRNDVLITANGTVVLKGFGDENGGSVVCVVPGSPYASESKQKRGISSSVGVSGGEGGVDLAEEATVITRLAMAQTERLQALRESLSQLCIAYGNGLFGGVGDVHATQKYQAAQENLIRLYTSLAAVP